MATSSVPPIIFTPALTGDASVWNPGEQEPITVSAGDGITTTTNGSDTEVSVRLAAGTNPLEFTSEGDLTVSAVSVLNLPYESRTVAEKLSDSIHVKDFGAIADDTADATLAIQAAIDYAIANKIGKVFLSGKYKITDTLVLDTADYSQGIILIGDGNTTQIRQVGENKDAIWFSTTQFLRNSGLRDLTIYCGTQAGHGINFKYGCTVCKFSGLNITVLNPNKSILYGDWTSLPINEGGIFGTVFEESDYYITSGHVVNGIYFLCKYTTFNENTFRNLRFNTTGSHPFLHIQATDLATYLVNNRFSNINFEVCKAGGMSAYNARNWTLENLSFWDAGEYTNHLVHFPVNDGLRSIGNTLIGVARHGDSLATGVRDIYLEYVDFTTLINCYVPSSSNPSYDWNYGTVTIIGPRLSGEVGIAARNYVDSSTLCAEYASFAGATGVPLRAEKLVSIERTATGTYKLTFITAKPDKGYRVHASTAYGVAGWVQATKELAYCTIHCTNSAGSPYDPTFVDVTIFD